MDKLKRLLKKLRLNSIYVRWILLFMLIISFAHGVTLFFTTHRYMPMIGENFGRLMERKAEFIIELSALGYEINDDTLKNTGDFTLDIIPFSQENLERLGDYMDDISITMLTQADKGEILIIESDRNFIFCLFKAGNQYAILIPNSSDNLVDVVSEAFGFITKFSSILAASLILIALIYIIRPIKNVITATEEVSKGNYDVEIKKKAGGDIGILIGNFNKMAKSLYKNEYLKKDFVSSVSHEFKTPITSIEGFAKLLRSEDLSREEIQDYTEIIIKESARLSNMSANLLKLSELDSREFQPVKNEYLLDEQIREIILVLEAEWEKKNIGFDLNMDEVLINANEELLYHVWFNLIHNAIKFSYDGGIIEISVKEEEHGVAVSVKDYGPGMSEEQTQRIFERFYQADETHSQDGSGLGLSIVKRIIDMLEASILCESTLGKGTVFTVNIDK